MVTRLRYPKGYQFFDKNGDPLALGHLYYYQAGTTTLQDTYSDDEGTIPNTNPLVLDGSGRLTTDVYLGSTADYKEVLTSSAATVSPWPADNIPHASAADTGGGTDLGVSYAASAVTLTSSSGSGVTVEAATGTTAGVLDSTRAAKIDSLGGLASLSSVNDSNWSGAALSVANGGTGETNANAAFNALSPMTATGDLITGGASGAAQRLGIGSTGQVLTVVGGAPAWSSTNQNAATYDVLSRYKVACWGDSTTAGAYAPATAYPKLLSQILQRPVISKGVGAQTSTQIAARMGAVAALATVSGGAIPASGGVIVTFPTGYEPVTAQGPTDLTGTIAGVSGSLTYSSGTITFTRTTAGSAVAVSSPTAFIPNVGDNLSSVVVIWAGRGNASAVDQVKADITAMVNSLGGNPNFIVLTVLNGEYGATEYSGGTLYANIIAINNWIVATYPNNSIDIRSYLVSQYNASVPQDVIDFGHDLVPSSLRYDSLHLNAAGNLLVAQKVSAFIKANFPANAANKDLTVSNLSILDAAIGTSYDGTSLFVPNLSLANGSTTQTNGSGANQTVTLTNPIWSFDPAKLGSAHSTFNFVSTYAPNLNSVTTAGAYGDTTFHLGYNIGPNNSRLNTSEPALGLSWEASYIQSGTGYTGDPVMEFHLQYFSMETGASRRPISIMMPRSDTYNAATPWIQLQTNKLVFTDWSWASRIKYNFDNATSTSVEHYKPTQYYFSTNDSVTAYQKNQANSAYLPLPYIDANNATRIPTTIFATPTALLGAFGSAFSLLMPTMGADNKGIYSYWTNDVTGAVYGSWTQGKASTYAWNLLYNTRTAGGSSAAWLRAAAGNAFSRYGNDALTTDWAVGLDAAASGAFKISKSTNVGTNDYLTVDTTGNVIIGNAALATSATNGFLHLPSSAGAPTGTPTAATGRVPVEIDTANGRLYAYYGGAWHYVSLN